MFMTDSLDHRMNFEECNFMQVGFLFPAGVLIKELRSSLASENYKLTVNYVIHELLLTLLIPLINMTG